LLFEQKFIGGKRKTSKKNTKATTKRPKQSSEHKKGVKMTTKIEVDCVTIHVAGAVYCLSDSVYFEVLKEIGGMLYLRTIIEVEDGIINYTFRWCEVPSEIMKLYDLADTKSFMSNSILFGCHLLRKSNNIYAITKFSDNPIGKTDRVSLDDVSEYDGKMFQSILNRVKL
jgi:hypothetical protein